MDSPEIAHRLALMAVGAVQPGVSSHQGKSGSCAPAPLEKKCSSPSRVTLLAIRSHLAG